MSYTKILYKPADVTWNEAEELPTVAAFATTSSLYHIYSNAVDEDTAHGDVVNEHFTLFAHTIAVSLVSEKYDASLLRMVKSAGASHGQSATTVIGILSQKP